MKKISKILKHILHQGYFTVLIIMFTYGCLLVDTFKYPGFIGKHFLIDAKIFLSIPITLLIISKNKVNKFLLKLNGLIILFSSIVLLTFSILEATNYPNYVLSKYHFNLVGLVYVMIFSLSIYIANVVQQEIHSQKISFAKIILIFVLVYALIVNIGITFQNALTKDIYIVLHINNNYDQKMFYQWGGYYNYMKFAKDNTPENATIIIPPQTNPWLSSGNILLDRYFLFPRNLVQTGLTIEGFNKPPKDAYIIVYKGEWCDSHDCEIWPTQAIKASELIIKKTDSFEVEKIINDFVYDPKNTKYPYGLLKI